MSVLLLFRFYLAKSKILFFKQPAHKETNDLVRDDTKDQQE